MMKGRKIKETGEASREMDRRNTAYINELYAITKAHLIAFRGRADKKLNKPKITLTKILKINTILRKLQEGV